MCTRDESKFLMSRGARSSPIAEVMSWKERCRIFALFNPFSVCDEIKCLNQGMSC